MFFFYSDKPSNLCIQIKCYEIYVLKIVCLVENVIKLLNTIDAQKNELPEYISVLKKA